MTATVCAMQQVLHLSCPTCGLTRSLDLLGHGHVMASLAMHPGGAALVAQAAFGSALCGMWLTGRVGQRPDRWIPRVVAWNAIAFLALWLIRLATGTLPPA